MATVRYICNTALRKIGRLGAGREPRTADATDTLNALKSLYRSLITGGAMARLSDVVPTGDYTARENERILRQSDATIEITLPELVPNWLPSYPYRYGDLWTPPVTSGDIQRNMRPPRDLAVVVVCDAFTGIMSDFIYDGTIKQWQSVNGTIAPGITLAGEVVPMTLDSEAPMSTRDPDGLSALLGRDIADVFGADLSPTTVQAAQRFEAALSHSYSFPREAVALEYF